MDQTHRFPSAGQAIGLLLIALALAIGLTYGLNRLAAILQIRLGASRGLFLGLVELLAFGSVLAWGWARTGAPFHEVFPLRRMRLSLLVPMFLSMIGIVLVNAEIASAVRPFLPRWARQVDVVPWIIQSAGPAGSPWSLAIALVIVAPLTEELLFRGLILQGFLSRYGERRSIIASAILFGAIHLDVLKVLGATALGALFAWLFVRTRSLVPSLVGHALHNGWQVLVLTIVAASIDPDSLAKMVAQGGSKPFAAETAVLGLVLTGLGVFWLNRMLMRGAGGGAEAKSDPAVMTATGWRNMSHYPNIRQAIWLLVAATLLILALSTGFGIAGGLFGAPVAEDPAVLAVINLVAIGIILRRGQGKTGAPAAEVFPLAPTRMSLLFPLGLAVVGGAVLLSETDNMLRTVLPMPDWVAEMFMKLYGTGSSRLGSILTLVIVAPLTEELLFRGLILRGFLRQYSVRKAIIASALLFGVFHFNPWQLIGAAVVGVLFAWVFVHTRSLVPCLLGHALYNAVPLIARDLLHLDVQGFTTGFSPVQFQPLWFDVLGLVLAASGVWLLMRAFRRVERRPLAAQSEPFPPSPT